MKKRLDKKILTGREVNDRALHDIAHNDLHDKGADLISQNLSDRKKLEEMLEASEKRYRTFFENSLDAILITSQDGAIYSANPAACKMLGWDENEICSLGRERLVEQTPQLTLALRRRKESGKFFGELTLIKKDGTRFPVELSSSVFTDSDGREVTMMIARDITERKKTEEKIRSASLYVRSLIEANPDPLVTINSEGKIKDVNLATEEITGFRRDKLIGSDFIDYFTESDKARQGYNTVFQEGVIKDYPLTISHRSGRTTDVLYSAKLFKNEAGEIQGIFAIAHDISMRRKMETRLRNSKKLLEKLNKHLFDVRESERAQIALNLHDDLGQKLTAINLDIAWIKSRIGVQSKTVQEKFKEMSLMIGETIESIKETSSFLRPAILFDLGLVPAIKSQLTNFEKQTGIKCHFDYEPEEFVLEDQLALILYRIFQESLTNIARHSGASVMELSLIRLNDVIELIIKDDGIGIENYKVNSLTSMGIQGITERVKSVRGQMSIKGEKGSGTTIRVSIPFKERKA